MSDKFALPSKKAAVFWPVGTGDSTTLVIKPGELVMQIDLRHLEKADEAEEPEWPIIDHLVRILPKRNGRPYLAVFALTHPDKDHIQGFKELLAKVQIGELWHTPKIFRDHDDDGEVMCPDAIAFRDEAQRRRKAILRNPSSVPSGDRLRVIGHDDVLTEDKYKGLPETAKSRPGHVVTLIDGHEMRDHFRAFIHAPFSADQDGDKNNTSLALNIVLLEGQKYAQFFFFGDREYSTIKRIFEVTEGTDNTFYLYWDVMLSSHHCSKCVMYARGDGEETATLKPDIMKLFEKYVRAGAHIVASAHSDFTDGEGDNPPHKRARARYEEIVDAGNFMCTHEIPNKANPEPVIFTLDAGGLKLEDTRVKGAVAAGLATAVSTARGGTPPPKVQVGFG